jgi:hypothetical protein
MAGERSKSFRSYRCTGRDKLRFAGSVCLASTGAEALDAAVWRSLSEAFTDARFLRATLEQREQELRGVLPGRVEELRKRATKLRRKEETAFNLLLDPDLSSDRTRIKAEYRSAAEERRQAEAELGQIERTQPAGGDWIDGTVRAIRKRVRGISPEAKQQFVRRFVQRAEWDGEEIRMVCFLGNELARSS